jgi:hypothetical protein
LPLFPLQGNPVVAKNQSARPIDGNTNKVGDILSFDLCASAPAVKNGKPNIAPLQPPTLATFRSWGSSAGAGRAGLPGSKVE